MKTTIHYKKAVIWGIAVLIIIMLVGNLLYLNPIVSGIYTQYEGHPSTKSMDYFGGTGNWISLMAVFGIIHGAIVIILYLLLYKGIPGTGWRRGLIFGLMCWVIGTVPEAFNQWMLFDYPIILIIIPLINGFIGWAVFGILISVFFQKFKVIE